MTGHNETLHWMVVIAPARRAPFGRTGDPAPGSAQPLELWSETFVMLQASMKGLPGCLDGFNGCFENNSVCNEPPSSAPGELPALSSC